MTDGHFYCCEIERVEQEYREDVIPLDHAIACLMRLGFSAREAAEDLAIVRGIE